MEISKYIQDELSFQATTGPFEALLHVSPFMTREKDGSDER